MEEFPGMRNLLARITKLERELSLKHLQITGILAITQAINENLSAAELFEMYKNFLKNELELGKMALFFGENGEWTCRAHFGFPVKMLEEDVSPALTKYQKRMLLEKGESPFVDLFEFIIPANHKDQPIAYVFIGGFQEEDDIYNKVQYVTTITNVISVALENKRLFKNQLQQEMINREVLLAEKIQRSLVPQKLPSCKDYQFDYIYQPHLAVGGDYYDAIEFSGGKIAFCIADIAGKGISAALLMANFQASLHTLMHKSHTLEEIVQEVNTAVYRVTKGDRFITLFLAKYDTETRTLHYINCGHTPPVLVFNGEAHLLKNGTTFLGFLEKLPKVQIGGVCLTGPATIFSYTDGLTEIKNKREEEFGDENLCKFLIENEHLAPADLHKKLMNHVEVFREDVPYPDDITVLTCRLP